MNKFDNGEYIEDEQFGAVYARRRKRRGMMAAIAGLLAMVMAVTGIGLLFSSANNEITDLDKAPVTLTLSSENMQLAAAPESDSPSYYLVDATAIVDEVLPSVVSITTRELVEYYNNYGGSYGGNMDDIISYFFGDSYGGRGGDYYYYNDGDSNGDRSNENDNNTEEPVEIESAMGSGTIVAKNDTELLILTSFHVVEGSSSLYVTFINDDSADGYVKAADEERDIAIVAIPLENISEETMNSIKIATICTEEPSVGEGVLVIGNALGYGVSVTTGIVSALEREIYVDGKTLTVLQTDAAINQGNSGGCMINSRGEVIGISEAKVWDSYVEGMCYAIPVSANLEVIGELLNAEGRYDENKASGPQEINNNSNYNGAYLGIRGRDVTNETSNDYGMPLGVYVSSTVDGSGAQDAGIQSGDIIVGINDTELTTMNELQYELSKYKAGDTVTLTIMRRVDGEYTTITADVTLTDRIS